MTHVRLDVWLDVACLFRTRSEAQKACNGGKVDVNRTAGKPHRGLRVGDEVIISRPFGQKQTVIVRALAVHHVPKALACQLYDDRTPPPSAEEVAARRDERIFQAAARAAGAPDKRQRRALRRLKGR